MARRRPVKEQAVTKPGNFCGELLRPVPIDGDHVLLRRNSRESPSLSGEIRCVRRTSLGPLDISLCHRLPPPLAGEGWGGGSIVAHLERRLRATDLPPPSPPPQAGEGTGPAGKVRSISVGLVASTTPHSAAMTGRGKALFVKYSPRR